MNKIWILCALLALSACAILQPGMKRDSALFSVAQPVSQQQEQPFVDETVEVFTEPPGARIHINGAFVGYAPLKYILRYLST